MVFITVWFLRLNYFSAIAFYRVGKGLRGDRTSSEKVIAVTDNEVIIGWVVLVNPSYRSGDRTKLSIICSKPKQTFFINYGYEEKKPNMPDFIVASLSDVEKIILGED